MTKEQIRRAIEEVRVELENNINSREDLTACQQLSEKLDVLIEKYYEL